MNPEPGNRRPFGFSMLGALLFFLALWRLDFPKPMVDDLFYIGSGINLATGSDLSNPLLVRQGFPSHYFFAYPPMHSYVLAGWLKICGISARSVTGLSALLYTVVAISTIAILRHYRAPQWVEWGVPLGVAGALFPDGLRPETLSIALTMTGFALFECLRPQMAVWFVSALLLLMGAATAPRIAPFAMVLMLACAFRLLTGTPAAAGSPPKRTKLVPVASITLAAALLVGLIFLVQIHFRLGEFLQTFRFHSQRAGGSRLKLLLGFLFSSDFMPAVELPVLLLLGHMLYFTWHRPDDPTRWAGYAVLWGFPLVWLAGGLGAGDPWFAVLATFLLAVSVSKGVLARAGILVTALAGCMLFANVPTFAQAYGLFRGKIRTDSGSLKEEALSRSAQPGGTLLVDHQVARYLFDYRLPPGCLDVAWAGDFTQPYFVKGIRDGDVLIVGANTVKTFYEYGHYAPLPARWAVLGMPDFQFEIHPRRVYIMDAAGCRGDWGD